MSSSALTALVGPIKYATAKGFANLHAVKGLRPLIEGALAKARAEGVDPKHLAALEAELPGVDAANEADRKAALTRVGRALAGLGLPVGFEPAPPPPRPSAPPATIQRPLTDAEREPLLAPLSAPPEPEEPSE